MGVDFHHTLDEAIRVHTLPSFNAQASSKRRAPGVEIQLFAFYGRGLQHIGRECGQGSAVSVGIGERCHAALQSAYREGYRRETACQHRIAARSTSD